MKNFLLAIILFTITGVVFSFSILFTPTVSALDVTPTIEPTPTTQLLPVNDTPCDGTVYPPNSECYAKVQRFEVQEIDLSGDQFFSYPLSCIGPPTVTYSETKESYINDENLFRFLETTLPKTVDVNTNVSDAQLGSLGPDSDTLGKSNPDVLAQKYLFNALFDHPGATPNSSKESFRSFWRMLDSRSQAQIKAFYIQNTNNHSYFYVGSDYKQHEVKINNLRSKLPICLKTFGLLTDNLFIDCWDKNLYIDQYTKLGISNPQAREEYDALLPFDFDNLRSYLVLGGTVSKENIPYLKAIISGLKGQKTLLNSVPGLFDFYTPDWARQDISRHLSAPIILEALQYPSLIIRALGSTCQIPSKASSVSSPKTYPSEENLSQTVSVPVTANKISDEENTCECPIGNIYCYIYNYCSNIGSNTLSCVAAGCTPKIGKSTYEITGTAQGKHITVFNNPYIDTLSDIVVGGKDPVGSKSTSNTTSLVANLVNDVVGFFSKSQPSFYKMLLPDFAPDPEKTMIRAPSANTSTDNPNATVTAPNTIYRENNLAQDTMHLLQNCWLVPDDQQKSSKCGSKKITAGVCDGTRLKEILGGTVTSPSSTALSYYETYIVPKLTPDVVNAYIVAEEQTGVPCEVLAGIHFEEGGNNPFQSLQDGRPLNGISLEESAIRAGQELNGKAGGAIDNLDTLMMALSRYNGGGNSNCQASTTCPAAASLDRCGMTVSCATDVSGCHCAPFSEAGSCRSSCGNGGFPWPIPYSFCPAGKEGYDDPYVTDWWISPEHDNMYLLFTYDCTQTIPVLHARPGTLTVALSIYLSSNPNP